MPTVISVTAARQALRQVSLALAGVGLASSLGSGIALLTALVLGLARLPARSEAQSLLSGLRSKRMRTNQQRGPLWHSASSTGELIRLAHAIAQRELGARLTPIVRSSILSKSFESSETSIR